VERGDQIVIPRNGPVARILPMGRPQRKPGMYKGLICIHSDFDAPLDPETEAAFHGEGS
jgi:antitoxin (DNA-binding transcriptional repressor) of toxin-antitoxin stability system